MHGLVHGFFPPLSQIDVGCLHVVIRLLDDGERGGLGDVEFDHERVSFSRKTATRVRPASSSGAIARSLVCRASSNSVSRRERRSSLSCRMRLRMNSLGVPKSPVATRSST